MSKAKFKDVFKVLVLGAHGVGKTTLIEEYSDNPLHEDIPDIGVNFFIKQVNVDGHDYTLQFWDFSNDEKFGSLHTLYYTGASAVFYVFDLSKPETFDYHQKYLKKVWNEGRLNRCPVLLIGNKLDLIENENAIDRKKYNEFVRKEGLLGYRETSMNNIDSIKKEVPNIIQRTLKKNYQVKFLVNSKEFKNIKRFAKIANQTQSEFIRTAIWEKIRSLGALSTTQISKKDKDTEENKLHIEELKSIRKLLEKLDQ